MTGWASDPFAQGSYSYIALGATPDDIDALAMPVGERLLFAGEATTRIHWGSMHSAYVSGLREAARLTGDQSLLPGRNFTENRRWREMLQRANRFFNVAGKSVDPEEVGCTRRGPRAELGLRKPLGRRSQGAGNDVRAARAQGR